MPVSQAQTGTARTIERASCRSVAASLAKPDLSQPARKLRGLGVVARDAGLRSSVGDLAEDCVPDDVAAGRALEGAGVELCNAVDVVLRAREGSGGEPHLRAQRAVRGEELERAVQAPGLVFGPALP